VAGISTKDLKNRIRSMESTRQITRAMEMVATSKLRLAQEKAIASRPYFEILYQTVLDLQDGTHREDDPFSAQRTEGPELWVVIAGDRGLAGGYNSSVLKSAWEQMDRENALALPLGKKAVEFFRSRNVPLLTGQYVQAAAISIGDCFTLARLLTEDFIAGKYRCIRLVYTHFASILNQTPAVIDLLPLPRNTANRGVSRTVLFEPDCKSVMNAIVPEYLGGLLYGALCDSVASEQAARRIAMDAATKNAGEMIDGLRLQFNRARQGAITQEITEIVAGSES